MSDLSIEAGHEKPGKEENSAYGEPESIISGHFHKSQNTRYLPRGPVRPKKTMCSVMSISFLTPWTVAHQGSLSMDFPGTNTGVGCHFLFQGIFLTQGLNLSLLHWQVDSLPMCHLGSPRDICLYSCMHTHMTWDILASKNS